MEGYRIKTEEELIADYGKKWRKSMPYGWNSQMEKELGQMLPKELLSWCKQSRAVSWLDWTWPKQSYTIAEPKFIRGVKTIKNGILNK